MSNVRSIKSLHRSLLWRYTRMLDRAKLRSEAKLNALSPDPNWQCDDGLYMSDVQREIERNSELKNIHAGKRCFIIGNGPSVNKQDLSLLGDEIVFTVNSASRLPQYSKLRSNYHLYMDNKLFVDEKLDVESIKALETDGNMPGLFFLAPYGISYARRHGLADAMDIHYIYPSLPLVSDGEVSADICKPTVSFYTVVQFAALAAAHMGCKEIYMLGCDCTGILPNIQYLDGKEELEGYAYELSDKDKKMLKAVYEKEGGIRMYETFDGWAKIFYGYRRLRESQETLGVHIYNATAGGILDELDRVRYESLF